MRPTPTALSHTEWIMLIFLILMFIAIFFVVLAIGKLKQTLDNSYDMGEYRITLMSRATTINLEGKNSCKIRGRDEAIKKAIQLSNDSIYVEVYDRYDQLIFSTENSFV